MLWHLDGNYGGGSVYERSGAVAAGGVDDVGPFLAYSDFHFVAYGAFHVGPVEYSNVGRQVCGLASRGIVVYGWFFWDGVPCFRSPWALLLSYRALILTL